jgi:hypothetical protein
MPLTRRSNYANCDCHYFEDERRSSFNFFETGDANLNLRNVEYLGSMGYPNLTDLEGKGNDKALQYFSAQPDDESGFHHYSSSFMDDDLTAIVKEVTILSSFVLACTKIIIINKQ